MGEVIEINKDNFQKVLEENENVVIDFWAEWCGPCKPVGEVLEELSEEFSNRMVVAKLDVDSNQEIAASFGITSIPTVIFFKNGKPKEQIIGALPKNEIKKWIEKNLNSQ